ncbi:MAG TPA: acyloxyacyl hydrolase [Flavipsychrobacter sp.]|nr:acyloxyacyl hydrolase [Flavipsychrobacter sp.]
MGQNTKSWKGFGIEANLMWGRIYKHTKNFKAPVPDISGAFELNFVQQTYGKKDWEQRRNYPVVGLGVTYTDYGIDSIFGKCFSVYPNLQLPIIRFKNVEWTFRAGFGIAYATRHYERAPVWDTLNNAVGTHLNNYTMFSTHIRYRVNEHWDIQIGGNFSHISNASLRTPNLGINLYGVHIGLRYFPITSQPEKIVKKLSSLKNRWLAQFRLGISANEAGVPNGPLYPIYIATAYASKRYKGKNKVFAGLDYSYHENIYSFLRNNEIEPGKEKSLSWKSSVFIGQEYLFGRFGVHLQLGYYLKESYLRLEKFYQKIGCNVYFLQREEGFLKESFLSIHLKTHKTQAEFAEVGLGIGF